MIETELIEECRNGNLANFRKVVEATSPYLFSVAFRMLGDEELSRDVVQETMITVWQKLKKIKTAESYKMWVYRIAMNKCYDQMRRSKIRPELRQDGKAWAIIANHLADESVSELDNEENALIINTLTDRLSRGQKAVFILSELENMSHDEISEITGMNKRSVKSNLYHARRNIENMIKKYSVL